MTDLAQYRRINYKFKKNPKWENISRNKFQRALSDKITYTIAYVENKSNLSYQPIATTVHKTMKEKVGFRTI